MADPDASEVIDTALCVSVSDGHHHAAATLLAAGADADVFRGSNNVFSIAVKNNDPRLVQMLLDSGADVDGLDMWVHLEREDGVNVLQLLLKNGLNLEEYGGDALAAASQLSDYDSIRLLLVSGVDIDAVDWRGATALMAAGRYGHLETVDELLRLGANVNAPAASGDWPYTAL